ncbi:MAG: hypothetical protein NHB14_00625 [Desulfosporosinus sp.]|nr:hypothetical protein [Desulfosporosinus sp.]
MIESKKPGSFLRHESQFEVGDRVETFNHCVGTVVRVDRDKIGVFIVVRLDILPREFAYEPCDLKKSNKFLLNY